MINMLSWNKLCSSHYMCSMPYSMAVLDSQLTDGPEILQSHANSHPALGVIPMAVSDGRYTSAKNS